MNNTAFKIFKILNVLLLIIDIIFLIYFIFNFSLIISNTIFATQNFKIITLIAIIFNAIYMLIQLLFSIFYRR